MNVLEAEITKRLLEGADTHDGRSGPGSVPLMPRLHIDQWLIHGLSALEGEALGFRYAAVAEARSRSALGEVGPRGETAFWPGLVDLFPASPSFDIGAWKLAPVVWYGSHIKLLNGSQGALSQQSVKKWKKWKPIDQSKLLDFVQDALKQRLEWPDEPERGKPPRLFRFLRPMPLPTSEQCDSGSGSALVLEVSSDRMVEVLPTSSEDTYFFVVGEVTRTHGFDIELITERAMRALYSDIAWHAQPTEIKCWDAGGDGLIALAVGIEGAVVVWSDRGAKVSSVSRTCKSEELAHFGPAADLGLLWLISIYQRETEKRCARYSVHLSEQLKSTVVDKQLMNDAKSLVRWAVQEELCWMYSQAGRGTQIDEAFQRFQKALDIERLWQDIREQCTALDNYLQSVHSGAQSRSLAYLTMLVVPVPLVTALLTLNASDVQKWAEYIRVEEAEPWLEQRVPNQTSLSSAMNCASQIDGSPPSASGSATGRGAPPSALKGTARCMLDASASDPSSRVSESAQVTQSAQGNRKFWNTNPLGLILGSVLALSLTMLAFAMNHPLTRYALAFGSVLVAAYFFAPGPAQTYSLWLAVVVYPVAWMWYFARKVKRGVAKWQPEYFVDGLLVFIAVVFAFILLRGLWLIGRPI